MGKIINEQPELGWVKTFLFEQPNAELFLVGGAVRDLLLERPTKDFDFVLRGLDKDAIEQWFGKHGEIDFTGRDFGVYKFVYTGVAKQANKIKEVIDIALPRTEASLPNSAGGYKDFSVEARMDLPIEMDLGRRDFTVNAMAINVRNGVLIDPYEGRHDLEAQVLRTVGDAEERFKEDLTRIVRGIRFSCSLSFHIEETTWKAIQRFSLKINDLRADGSFVVAREAIGREFLKSFFHDPVCTLVKYQLSGLGAMLFSGFDLARAEQLVEETSGLPPRLLTALFLTCADPTIARATALDYHFHQFPKDGRFHIDLEEVMWLVRSAHALDIVENPSAMPGSLFERLFMGAKGDDLLSLIALTNSASKQKITAVRERLTAIHDQFGDTIPELLSGEDLIGAGLKPGPKFREVLTKIRDAQFAGTVSTKDEALAFLQSLQSV